MKKLASLLLALGIASSLAAPAAAAEKELKADSTWVITDSSHADRKPGSLVFDGDKSTYWHTYYKREDGVMTEKAEGPHWVEVELPQNTSITGMIYTPRQDSQTGIVNSYKVLVSANGKDYTEAYSGTFDYGEKYSDLSDKKVTWNAVNARKVKIQVVSSVRDFAAICEITLLTDGAKVENVEKVESGDTKSDNKEDKKDETVKDEKDADDNRLPRDGWTVTASSTAQGAYAEKILDGNENTYWHSYYRLEGTQVVESDPAPFQIDFTLPSDTLISGVVFTPRKDRNSGRILAGNLYVSDSDDGEWFLLRENMTFEDTAVDKSILFGANISVKRIRFEVTGTKYGTMAEFYALKPDDNYQTLGYEEFRAMDEQLRLYEIDRGEMTASYDGDVWTDHTADKVLDGNEKTCWQCTPIPQWQSGEEYSVYFNVDLGDNYKLKQIDIVPRQTPDSHGCWKNFNVLISTDGENFTAAKENITAEENIKTRTVVFDNEVNARFVRFEIKNGFASRASCAEIKFYQSKAGRDEYMENSKEQYVLYIGRNEIAAHVGGEDKTVTLDTAPFIGNGSTMIPLRGLLEAMGADITWKGETEEIEIKKDAYNIRLQIWNRLVYVKDPKYQAFGELRFTLINEPVIKDSRTFIPLRFVSEQLGYDVSWDSGEQKITITKNM